MLMMRPQRRLRMLGAASWANWNSALRFTASIRSNVARSSRSKATSPPIPALLTRISMAPKSRSAPAQNFRTASASETSHRSAWAVRPIAAISATTPSASSSPSWQMITSAPSAAKASAIAAPMPRLPPVTNATLLSRRLPIMSLTLAGKPHKQALGQLLKREIADARVENQHQRDQGHAAGLAHELREGEDPAEPAVDPDIFARNHR